MSVKKIILVSHPRSGSSYVNRLLGNFDKINIVMEPFHQYEDVSTAHVRAILSNKYADFISHLKHLNTSLYEYAHNKPKEFIELIGDHTECEYLALKIFPDHLSDEKLEALLASSSVVIFLRRNPLHSYISSRIANQFEIWGGKDTSKIKVSIDEESYIKWNNRNWSFLEKAKTIVKQHELEYFDLKYETLLDPDKAIKHIGYLLKAHHINAQPKSNLAMGSKKQDQRESALDKVSNIDELHQLTKKFKIERLIDGSEPVTAYEELTADKTSRFKTFLSNIASKLRI